MNGWIKINGLDGFKKLIRNILFYFIILKF